jgi:hypothetical protein
MDCSAEPEHAPHPPFEITSPRKAERPIPGTRRFAAPSAASASVAAPPSRTCGAPGSVLHQRSGRQASVSPRTADTRAAMTAESTAVCDQQNRRGRRASALGECSVPGRATDRWPLPARKLVDDYAQFAQACQDSASGTVDACGPKSPDSHRVVWGLTSRPPVPPAGFPPVSRLPAGFFPFARLPLVSLRPAFSGLFPSAVAPVPAPLRCPSGFPSPERSSR